MKFYNQNKSTFHLGVILLLGLLIRAIGFNWDNGHFLHPDERMLMMVTERIKLFSQLNPDFFSYGALPVYILRGVIQLLEGCCYAAPITYNSGLGDVARSLSMLFDVWVIFMIYLIGRLIFTPSKIALLGALLYAIMFFPIQNSHFFIVDGLLNALIISSVYVLLKEVSLSNEPGPSKKRFPYWVVLAVLLGMAVGTKFTAVIWVGLSGLILLFTWFHESKKRKNLVAMFTKLLTWSSITILTVFISMPYSFILFQRFFSDISLQLKMNNDAYIFPYTLQYVGTAPYLYYLENIFFWGAGPIMALLAVYGGVLLLKGKTGTSKDIQWKLLCIVALFYGIYFIFIGRSAVKFMRYLLPLYPLIALLGGYALFYIRKNIVRGKLIAVSILVLCIIWTSSFIYGIYGGLKNSAHSRVRASDWIVENIPAGSTLAVEHWDDRLPFREQARYSFVELNLYDRPDNDVKWALMADKLDKADYIILSSNRLYKPLQRLTDCSRYKACYPLTAKYYQELFSGELGFEKVMEFTAYPTVPFLGIEINDDSADESFTVYDHPKVMIYKNLLKNPSAP